MEEEEDFNLGEIDQPLVGDELLRGDGGTPAGEDDEAAQARKKAAAAKIDKLVPRIIKLRDDMNIVKTAVDDLRDGYAAIMQTEQYIIQILNRNASFPITVVEDCPVAKWDALVKELDATTSGPQADYVFNSLRDTVFVDVCSVISQARRGYRRLGVKVEQEYKVIRDPAWPLEERNIRKIIDLDNNRTEEKINEQTEAVQTWICNTAEEWTKIQANAAKGLEWLKKETGVDTLSPEQIQHWCQRPAKDRQEAIFQLVSGTLSTSRSESVEEGAYLAEWRDIRRWTAVLLVDQVGSELHTMLQGYERMFNTAVERFPDLQGDPV